MNALPQGYLSTVENLPLNGFKNAPEDVWQSAHAR